MKFFKSSNKLINSNHFIIIFLNLFVILFLFLLPYYLFEGRLFLGGDDTRFYYAYPKEVLKSLTFFSWNNISSLPYYIPNHHWIPFLLIASFLDTVLNSKQQLFYLLFSSNLIIGFIYFQKFVRELIGKEYTISFLTSIVYILSPITIVSLSFFLAPVWLISLFPIIAYYFIVYVRKGRYFDLIKVVIWSVVYSFAFYSIPWILGLALPFTVAFFFYLIFIDNPIKKILKRSTIFLYFIISSQLFWLIPFFTSLFKGGADGLGEKIVSEDLVESFVTTVSETATGNIIYPLLTFYHKQIAIDNDWQIGNVFLAYYDLILPLASVFVIVLFIGLIKYKKALKNDQEKTFLFIFISFLLSLFLFTVNIGFLKELFLLFGNIPGFAIFRNFTDKFALGYIFIYSSLLSFCFYIVKKSTKYYITILFFSVLVVLINFLPIKQIIVSPMWRTNSIYTTINIPEEYLKFSKKAGGIISNETNVISFPQNIASYSIITEENDKNAYVGTSPFKFFSGINDLTGNFSYSPNMSKLIQELIYKKDYNQLLLLLSQLNTGYIMVTKNIPQEITNGYLFDSDYLRHQDDKLIESLVEKEILASEHGNYVIYKLKNNPSIINTSKGNISYKKNNPISYKIQVNNLEGDMDLNFYETFDKGWRISLLKQENIINNKTPGNLFLNTILSPPFFNDSHTYINPYGNKWTLNSDKIKDSYNDEYYVLNDDGSIDVVLGLYFTSQIYFYLGILISILFLLFGLVLLVLKDKK